MHFCVNSPQLLLQGLRTALAAASGGGLPPSWAHLSRARSVTGASRWAQGSAHNRLMLESWFAQKPASKLLLTALYCRRVLNVVGCGQACCVNES